MVTNPDKPTAALLGAGASVEAGIPTAMKITRKIYDLIAEDRRHDYIYSKALGYIIAGLLFQKSTKGHSPYGELDIEEIFTVIAQIANREKLEILPFISSWHPAINLLDTKPTYTTRNRSAFKDSLRRLLDNRNRSAGSDIEREELYSIIQKIANDVPKSGVFKNLVHLIMTKLAEITYVEDPSVVDYLKPLLLLTNLKFISTLNYDNTIELAASSAGTDYSIGVEDWTEHTHVSFAPDRLKLLKLHGSINWTKYSARNTIGKGPRYIGLRIKTGRIGGGTRFGSYIVFGKGDKLTSIGPFLEIYNEFTASLEHVTHLLIVGYSFRDIHINTAVKKWFDTDTDRTVQIIGSRRVKECKEQLFQYFLWMKEKSGRVGISDKGAAKGLKRLAEG